MSTPKSRPYDPVTVIQAGARKQAEKADRAATRDAFTTFLVVFAFLHFIGHLALTRSGVQGYFRHLIDVLVMFRDYPVTAGIVVVNLFALAYGIHQWRHRYDEKERVLPPYPPIPDLRHCNDIYIGSGYTTDGKQPGDIVKPGEVLLEPHVVFNEKGLVGNLHVKGGIGSGKTSTMIYPFLDQAIMKYPKPLAPERFKVGVSGRITSDTPEVDRSEEDPFDRALWNPYVGMKLPEAQARYEELCAEHDEKKWGMLVFDPKKDITKFVLQSAKAAGRENDVIILRPDAEWTYNPLATTSKELVLAETFMDGIEAVTGQTMQGYYRQTGSEWLANALSILRTVEPARTTFETLLTMARREDMRSQWVNQAITKMRDCQRDEERHRRLGRIYRGPRVNPAAIEFFRHWDEVDADPTQKRAVTSGIKAQAKFFVDEELRPWLCPAMPPTFKGFHEMIDKGQIVVFQMSLADYKTVSRVLGILLLMDAQSAALSRLDPESPINKERVIVHCIDEVASYLNGETKKFISLNRQARVINLFAHQSQGQLLTDTDKGFEVSFNDNLRSKISYSAPNAIAASKESQLFGRRYLTKERYSEGSTLRGAVHEDGGDTIRAGGGEMRSATVSMEEVERSWFDGQDFMSMETGECIVSEFDGNTTKDPRKILAPSLWDTPRGRRIMALPVRVQTRRPHPVVHIGSSEAGSVHLDTGLGNTGYTFVETLLDRTGEPRGMKFVTEAGTMILPLELMRTEPEIYDAVGKQLGDAHGVVVLTDGLRSATLLKKECSVRFERVLPLPEALAETGEHSARPLIERFGIDAASVHSFRDLVRKVTGEEVPYADVGSWEYHTADGNQRTVDIEEASRALIALYIRLGEILHELGDDAVEDLYDLMLTDLDNRLTAAAATAVPTDDEDTDPSPQSPAPRSEASEVVTGESKPRGGDTPKNSTTTSRRRRMTDPSTPPLFDLDELNDALKPSPFDDSTTGGPGRSAPDPNDPHTGGETGRGDAGPDRERPLPPADLQDQHPDAPEDLGQGYADDPQWPAEDYDPTDDDYLPEE